MEVLQYFSDNHAALLYLIAGICFIVELSVLGMSGPLLFFAIACCLTGFLVNLGLIHSWVFSVFSVGLLTAVSFLLLWKPLKHFQNSGGGPDTSSDMIGLQVVCSADISLNDGAIRYSGINWQARLMPASQTQLITEGQLCEIVAVKGNVMVVKVVT